MRRGSTTAEIRARGNWRAVEGVSKVALLAYMNWLTPEALSEPPEGWIYASRGAGYDGVQFIEPLAFQTYVSTVTFRCARLEYEFRLRGQSLHGLQY